MCNSTFFAKLLLLTLLLTGIVPNIVESVHSRIVEGQDASRGQFPYYVLLNMTVLDGNAFCGGVLISNQWILTAAHCLRDTVDGEIHLGSLRQANLSENGRIVIEFDMDDGHIYPRYYPSIVWNDIGLIKLPKPVESSDVIQPIKLACTSNKDLLDVTVIGNGISSPEHGTIASILQWTNLKTVSYGECLREYPFLLFRKSVICARGEQKESACHGDSGGPLIDRKTNSLIGLTSFVSFKGCHQGLPQGYTYVQSYYSWIENVTGLPMPQCSSKMI